ncbi:MAG: lycopene cyclase domain-containing protein [Elusimicrobiales bacterium]
MPEPAPNDEDAKKTSAAATGPKRWPATVVLVAPFMLLAIPLYRAARRSVHWPAAIAMICTFEAVMFLAEYFSVSRQHWIWNPDRVVGPMFFGIPIEEPLLYYWFPPLFVVICLHAIKNWLDGRKGGTA